MTAKRSISALSLAGRTVALLVVSVLLLQNIPLRQVAHVAFGMKLPCCETSECCCEKGHCLCSPRKAHHDDAGGHTEADEPLLQSCGLDSHGTLIVFSIPKGQTTAGGELLPPRPPGDRRLSASISSIAPQFVPDGPLRPPRSHAG